MTGPRDHTINGVRKRILACASNIVKLKEAGLQMQIHGDQKSALYFEACIRSEETRIKALVLWLEIAYRIGEQEIKFEGKENA